MVLAKAAQILRESISACHSSFNGNFDAEYMESCVPPEVVQFVSSISHGAGIKLHMKNGTSTADVAIAQLIQFNCFATYNADAMYHRHSKNTEPAFPVYLRLSVYSETRKKKLINTLFENGLSISYTRVLEISTQLRRSNSKQICRHRCCLPS